MSDALDEVRAQRVPVDVLRRAVAHDRLAGAYLFEGPSGVGKERTALALARLVLGPDAANRIDHGTHPDVRVFRPRDEGHRNIKVETLREDVLPYAEFAPFEGTHAFLIFPEAHLSFPRNHPESANALLKTLEEPKKGVTFVLLSERPDRLLPTIRSRCQRLRFGRLPEEVLHEILARHEVPQELRDAAVALADGRADVALRLSEENTAGALLELALRVDDAVGGNRPGALVLVAEELAKHEQRTLALDALGLFYRDVAASAAGLADDRLRFRHRADLIRTRAARLSPRTAAERVALIQQALEHLEANAQPQMAMDALVHRMRTTH